MSASQLSVYNKALRWLEERPCASLSEPREPVRLLNAEWQDGVNFCLESGYWKHAMRQVQALPDTTRTPNFGRKYSYQKPVDWVKTYQLSQDDRFLLLDREFVDQNDSWFSDLPYFYVRYVSSDASYGWNLAFWTMKFTEFVGCYLAFTICGRIKQAMDKKEMLTKELKRVKAEALAADAMDGAVGRRVPDTWVTSRSPRGAIYPFAGGWDEGA